MQRISLTRNLNGTVNPEQLQFQMGEILARLEDYLNNRVDIHYVDTNNRLKVLPTLQKGDLVFDFTKSPQIATLQQWDGIKLIPLGFDTISGFIDLIKRGVGSGTDRNMLLASNGAGGWELRIPEQIEFLAAEFIPAFSLVTANGRIANSSTPAHFNQVIGMTIVDTANGARGEATVDGEIVNNSWSWSPSSKLFLNGSTVSLSAPSSGFSQLVAVARNNQIIIMKIAQAILL